VFLSLQGRFESDVGGFVWCRVMGAGVGTIAHLTCSDLISKTQAWARNGRSGEDFDVGRHVCWLCPCCHYPFVFFLVRQRFNADDN
jgi:hypothetical protein